MRLGSVGFMRQGFLGVLFPTLALFLIAPVFGDAQEVVTTNITSTTGIGNLGTTVTHEGNLYNITGGTRPGGATGTNLFHSFGDFSVGAGDIGNFLNNTGLPTSNILGRVTGGNTSNIDGVIQTTGFGSANLFLVNPSGIVFGPHGSFEVGGSVSLSTANYLRFEGTATLFDMLSSPASLGPLSVAPVVAFGFLGLVPPAPITVQGTILQVPEGESLSLVGGNITVQASSLQDGTVQSASLRASGGQLNMVSVASSGEVLVPGFQTGPNINGASFTEMGAVTLKEGATLDVSGQLDEFGSPIGNGNSGTVFVRGGQLVMDASTIQAITWGAVDGARTAVDIQASQKVELTNSSFITTATFGPGRGGDVQLTAGTLTLENFSSIVTATIDGGGVGGNVVLNMGTVILTDAASIQSQTQNLTPGSGRGGDVIIQGLPEAEFGAAESVTLSGGSSLVTETFLSSNGGEVAIMSKSLTMDGPGTTIHAEAHDVGLGGDLVLSVQQASLSDGATITTTQAFNADPNAQQGPTLTVQGLTGDGSRAVSVVLSGLGSGIISDSSGTARAADVAINAKTVTLADGAVIQAGTTVTSGTGGNVSIEADSVDISGGSRISSQASRSDAGQITITANTLTLDNGSIATNTLNEGRAGDVVLNAGTLSISNGANINTSTISSGRAGDITIKAGSVTLTDRAEIASASTGPEATGNAGDISINSKEVPGNTFEMWHSTISTSAALADGGNIGIFATNMVRLTDSIITSSVGNETKTDTLGGNITIDPQFVVLQNSQIRANAFAGAGGAIDIIATSAFIADPVSIVDASSTRGISGTVNIQSPLQNVGGELTALSQEFSSAAALLAQQCAARAADGKFSTFVVAAREGLPAEPGGFLASPSLTSELLGSRLSGRDPQTQLSAVTGLFPKYDARPIQLARFGDACHR